MRSACESDRSLELDLIAIGIDHHERPLAPTALPRPPARLDSTLPQACISLIQVSYGELDVKAGLARTKQPEPHIADTKQGEFTRPMALQLDTGDAHVEGARPLHVLHVKGQTLE